MAKLNREAMAHFLDYSFKLAAETATWEILGEDIEDMSVELNPDTETKKTILGKTKVTDNGYEPSMSADPFYADLEKEMLEKINKLGIGPQGFGGKTTAIGLNIETLPTHIAGMPCAVNINCHVTRHKTEVI